MHARLTGAQDPATSNMSAETGEQPFLHFGQQLPSCNLNSHI